VCAVLEDGLAGLIGIRESRGIDVVDHLVPLARGAGSESVVEGRFREQRQRVRLLLGHRRRLRGTVHVYGFPGPRARLLVESLAGCGQRLQEQRPDLGGQPPPDRDHAVFILIHVKRPAHMLPLGFPGLGDPIHPSPPPHDPFDVLRCAGAPHR
jgi:hypothetical protein